jgi:thiamine kinase-like enzyme
LRQLHQLAAPSTHVIDLRESVAGYVGTLEERRRTTMLVATDVARAMEIAARAMKDLQLVLCHNDVHHLNLIDDSERLWLIDWEYAGLGNPLFDLAAVCCYHNYDAALRRGLAECYWGSCSAAQLAQLDEMCWLFDYIKELWFAVRAADAALTVEG